MVCVGTVNQESVKHTMARDNRKPILHLHPKYPDQKLHVTLPVPPSVNHMYIMTGRSKTLTREAIEYVRESQKRTKEAMMEQGWKVEEEGVWLYCDLYFYFKDRRKRDTHNTLKILMDSLEFLAFEDDYYVLVRTHSVKLDRENPRVEMVMYPQLEIGGPLEVEKEWVTLNGKEEDDNETDEIG